MKSELRNHIIEENKYYSLLEGNPQYKLQGRSNNKVVVGIIKGDPNQHNETDQLNFKYFDTWKDAYIQLQGGNIDMKTTKTNKSTYEAMNIIRETFNCVGTYKYILDNEIIEGYEYKEINENYHDQFTPILKVECSDGYFYATNHKDDVKNKFKKAN